MTTLHRLDGPLSPLTSPPADELASPVEERSAHSRHSDHSAAPGATHARRGLAAFTDVSRSWAARSATGTASATSAANRSASSSPAVGDAEDVRAAAEALRPLRAWLRHYAMQEGNDSQTMLGSAEADQVARALLAQPGHLHGPVERAVLPGRCLLAARRPGQALLLSAEQAQRLDRAVSALERPQP